MVHQTVVIGRQDSETAGQLKDVEHLFLEPHGKRVPVVLVMVVGTQGEMFGAGFPPAPEEGFRGLQVHRHHVGNDVDDDVGLQLDLSRRVATPSDDYANKRLMEEIKLALEQLPHKQHLTAVLHDIEGYSKSEIAQIFNCPEATVRSNLHIARTKLRKILKQRLEKRE